MTTPSQAADATAKSQNAIVRLVSEATAIHPGKPFTVALHMKLAPKWHTYWKNPGDSGMPVRIVWTLPEVLRAGELQFPAPTKSVDGGLALYGYDNEAAFLTEITPQATMPPGDYTISAKATWLECADICVPAKAELRFNLPVGKAGAAATDAAAASIFTNARRALPITNPAFKFTTAEKSGRFVLITSGTRALKAPVQFFPEVAGLIEAAEDQTASLTAAGWEISVRRPANATPIPSTLKGILVSGEGAARQAFHFTTTPSVTASKK